MLRPWNLWEVWNLCARNHNDWGGGGEEVEKEIRARAVQHECSFSNKSTYAIHTQIVHTRATRHECKWQTQEVAKQVHDTDTRTPSQSCMVKRHVWTLSVFGFEGKGTTMTVRLWWALGQILSHYYHIGESPQFSRSWILQKGDKKPPPPNAAKENVCVRLFFFVN